MPIFSNGMLVMTNKQLYDSYRDRDSTDALRAHRLKTLRDRANCGNSDAYRYVRLIERGK